MKKPFKYLLIGLAAVVLFAAFTLSTDFEDKISKDPPSSIPLCGMESQSDSRQPGMNHLDCHSPVTSYVDLLPPPPLMDGIGTSHITITTKSDMGQKYFDQGLSLLHDFWDFEAYRAFKYAVQLDSTSAMSHWGIAYTIAYNTSREKEYKRALAMAKKYSSKTSPQEQLYIKAIIVKDSLGNEKGSDAFRSTMEKLIYKYPNDPEAKLILWNKALDGGYNAEGDPNKDAVYAQLLLEKLFITHPNHPGVHHFWIHQMENCCPEQALASADALAAMTPNSGHMVHMPGHIYYRTGDYKKARASFIASMKVDSAYMVRQKITQLDNWNYMHNLHYLIANCAEEGKYMEASYWHKRLEEVPPPVDSLKARLKEYRQSVFARKVSFGADLELRFGLWDKVIERYSKIPDNDSIFEVAKVYRVYKNVLLEYAKGMYAIENKKYDQAKSSADALDAMLWRNIKQDKIEVWESDKKFNVQSMELRANILSATGDYKKALELLKQAQEYEKGLGYWEPPPYARPVAESIAQAHLRAKEYEKARETYKGMLDKRPNSGFALFGIAQTYELAGNKSEAEKYYIQFKKVWDNADPSLPQVKKANQWLAANAK